MPKVGSIKVTLPPGDSHIVLSWEPSDGSSLFYVWRANPLTGAKLGHRRLVDGWPNVVESIGAEVNEAIVKALSG